MRVLAFASQKSGAGKTTLAGHMAVQAQKGGIGNVALIDVDPEASLADWCAQRGDQPVKYARATQADLLQKIENLRADVRVQCLIGAGRLHDRRHPRQQQHGHERGAPQHPVAGGTVE